MRRALCTIAPLHTSDSAHSIHARPQVSQHQLRLDALSGVLGTERQEEASHGPLSRRKGNAYSPSIVRVGLSVHYSVLSVALDTLVSKRAQADKVGSAWRISAGGIASHVPCCLAAVKQTQRPSPAVERSGHELA